MHNNVGDVFHQPPLILLPFYALAKIPHLDKLFFVVIDLVAALLIRELATLWRQRLQQVKYGKPSTSTSSNLPDLAASVYLFNPLTIMTCIGMSTIVLSNLAIFLSCYFALRGNRPLMVFSICFAAYNSMYPIILLLPLALLLPRKVSV